MKTRMVEERIGEYLGPVDWSYDFTQHDWGGGHGGVNPDCSVRGVDFLRQLEQPARWRVMIHQSWHDVLQVGMYDGWPFWKPTPSVQVHTWLGPEWHPFYNVQAVESVA